MFIDRREAVLSTVDPVHIQRVTLGPQQVALDSSILLVKVYLSDQYNVTSVIKSFPTIFYVFLAISIFSWQCVCAHVCVCSNSNFKTLLVEDISLAFTKL